ncbi:hypothetical protein KDH_35980 [Dictyobacter sp. S3.2.2.5]|uniref:BON domain-containing protein n=1 Tax=Dictyobacter halimunensis TaxID=3026934 RepID=A0ABQ6FR75_9CHLR|nr:hypothetical protein KDH_35980 [Dictyobacter sp. S3.2.2.5]
MVVREVRGVQEAQAVVREAQVVVREAQVVVREAQVPVVHLSPVI